MAHSHEHRGIPDEQRLFNFAIAYIDAAIGGCQRMIDEPATATWPHASVALFEAAHASELFLKAVLLRAGDPAGRSHDLVTLDANARRLNLLPDGLQLPMVAHLLGGLTEEDHRRARKNGGAVDPSIAYRYPFANPGEEWDFAHTVTPAEFRIQLLEVKGQLVRIWADHAASERHDHGRTG